LGTRVLLLLNVVLLQNIVLLKRLRDGGVLIIVADVVLFNEVVEGSQIRVGAGS
jgi:hypothetical protein